ncbi:MAG: GntR family transcriptional regulator [Thermaerobacter sp.]|nr:GntR family transcriptional regulator [Thermaerobacter sp.]
MNVLNSPHDKATRADTVYETMVREIHGGLLTAGQRVVETDWARRLAVSVTPVREALRRLEADGVCVRDPHSGVRVRLWDQVEARAVYEARAAIEAEITALAARRATDDELVMLRDTLNQQRQALTQGEFREAQQLDTTFHLQLGQLAQSEVLASCLYKLWLLVPVLRTTVWQANQDANLGHMIPDHELLCDCLDHRHPEAAQEVARRHVHEAWIRVERAHQFPGHRSSHRSPGSGFRTPREEG